MSLISKCVTRLHTAKTLFTINVQLLKSQRFPYNQTIPRIYTSRTLRKSFCRGSVDASMDNVAANRSIAWWLLGCGGVVASMVTVGGITRLTRSGLSMVTWKPYGGLPPLNDKEWEEEFNRYKSFPEFRQRSHMSLDEFKSIFWWEYGHRMLGRFTGLCFGLPLCYFLLKKRIPQELYGRLAALFGLGALQGGIGWWMVKSGLEGIKDNERKEIRVSPYRLATHLLMAFTTYSLLLWTAFDILYPKSNLSIARDMLDPYALKKSAFIRKTALGTAILLGITVASGAFVAGIDAGRVYNTFPKMDNDWIPNDIWDLSPQYKNFFENSSLVQFNHRVLAMSTFTGVLVTYALSRKQHVWRQLPQVTRSALNTSLALSLAQVSLGISTLLTYVPVPLAAAHQAGSLALLSSMLWTLHTLRFAKLSRLNWFKRV